jgi:hypothetical protein
MDDFLYNIKTSSPEDVITLFKTIDIKEDTTSYVYHVMANPSLFYIIENISDLYIDKEVYTIFYEIIDGWADHCIKNDLIKKKVSNILIKILHSDKIKCDKFSIDFLKKNFNINYYAEIMMG